MRLCDWTSEWWRTFLCRNFARGLDIRRRCDRGQRRRFLRLGLRQNGCSREHSQKGQARSVSHPARKTRTRLLSNVKLPVSRALRKRPRENQRKCDYYSNPEASRADNSLTIGKCAYHGQISRRPVKAMALILHSFSDDELTSSHFVHDWQLLFR